MEAQSRLVVVSRRWKGRKMFESGGLEVKHVGFEKIECEITFLHPGAGLQGLGRQVTEMAGHKKWMEKSK